jgi:uncharacterized protein (DUF1499 family)
VVKKRMVVGLAVLVGVLLVGTAGLVLLSRRPVRAGLVDGRLAPCPPKPNCVCSQDPDAAHRVDPIAFGGSPEEALAAIVALVEADPLAELAGHEGRWVHAVWRSPVMGFRDDVELLVDRDAGVIHVRAAARVGYSDLGANARRVESIRERLR